jgi:methyltransferase
VDIVAIGLLVFVPMLIETARASRNERAQRARGGLEPPGDVYPIMRIVYPGSFVAMLAERAARDPVSGAAVVTGLMIFAAAKWLKWSAIVALGRSWTFRVVVVPADRLVASGPYRYLRHPNYVGVIGEIAGAAIMTGAIVAGPIAVLVFAWLLVRRIAVEERMLYSQTPPAEHED